MKKKSTLQTKHLVQQITAAAGKVKNGHFFSKCTHSLINTALFLLLLYVVLATVLQSLFSKTVGLSTVLLFLVAHGFSLVLKNELKQASVKLGSKIHAFL